MLVSLLVAVPEATGGVVSYSKVDAVGAHGDGAVDAVFVDGCFIVGRDPAGQASEGHRRFGASIFMEADGYGVVLDVMFWVGLGVGEGALHLCRDGCGEG